MNIEFSGRTAIVTGAAHGFGRAIAKALSERGASVWACDVLGDELKQTQLLCEDTGNICHIDTVNIRNRDEVFAFVDKAIQTDGKVDILVNNAGGVLGQVGRPLEDITTEDWDSIYEVNTRGAFYFSQAVAPSMKANQYGRIINISSGAGLGISLTGIQAYASAKAAQIGLTRQLAHELGEWNITVNNIAPGFVLSNPTTGKQWDAYGKDGQQALLKNIAMRRLGSPADIAHGVLYFASDYAGWTTGQVISIDGGK